MYETLVKYALVKLSNPDTTDIDTHYEANGRKYSKVRSIEHFCIVSN